MKDFFRNDFMSSIGFGIMVLLICHGCSRCKEAGANARLIEAQAEKLEASK